MPKVLYVVLVDTVAAAVLVVYTWIRFLQFLFVRK